MHACRSTLEDPTDEKWSTLVRFEDEVEELLKAEVVRKRSNISANMHCDQETGLTFTWEERPSDDAVKALLHRMRPFILVDEPTHFGKARKALARTIWIPVLESVVQRQREKFNGREFQSQVQFFVRERAGADAIILNSDEMLMKWLNAFEYHRDRDKREEIERLAAPLSRDYFEFIYLNLMMEKLDAVIELGRLVYLLRKREGQVFVFEYISDATGKPLRKSPDLERMDESMPPVLRPRRSMAQLAPATQPREYKSRVAFSVHPQAQEA